ncbi:sensor histidine kinase [Cohnella sp. AR92]|uniref:sensor histidine kinase n=1 Tax=Cohnella sp. AR92 TaxID=648716 RepID=UPI000F8C3A36|nr:sensor histidine kinase [Cohnella sp. AR92]RUS45646.1 sensor histidine kinase [Cohnella sp. AR92]
MIKRFFRRLDNLGIRHKLFASYLLVICIPFLLLLFIHINLTQRENKDQMLYSSHKMLDETKSYLEFKAQAIMEVVNFIAFNDLVQANVSEDPRKYEDVNLWGTDANSLAKLLNRYRNNDDIATIQLYMKAGLASAAENPDYLNMGNVEETDWFKKFAASHSAYVWIPSSSLDNGIASESSQVNILRKIPNAHNIQEFDGIVRAQVKQSAMQSVLDHAILTVNASAVLFNDQGQILSHSSGFPYSKEELFDMLNHHPATYDEDNYWNDNLSLGAKRFLFGVQAIPHTDMKVALIVPYTDVLHATDKARNRLISIFLMVVPLVFPVSYLVAASATKRIRRLIVHVRKVRKGNFNLEPLPANEDEIGELTHSINVMVKDISGLMEETYTLGREVKNKELKALQSQINPHFLYNTLDLINIMAIESGAKDISKVVEELAIFYKLSLSNGREIVPLENELMHIQAYVRIQNMRFGGGVRLDVEVPSELYDLEVPKIILQPIVENAILHGIMEKDEEAGTIRISAFSDHTGTFLVVEDDGVGMSPERMDRILAGGSDHASGGYGLRNIQERLQLAYGMQYGVGFESEPGGGTSVRLRLPPTAALKKAVP